MLGWRKQRTGSSWCFSMGSKFWEIRTMKKRQDDNCKTKNSVFTLSISEGRCSHGSLWKKQPHQNTTTVWYLLLLVLSLLLLLFCVCVRACACMCVCVCTCLPWHMYRSQRTAYESQFPPAIVCAPGTELRSSGLETCAFTSETSHWPNIYFLEPRK